MDVIKEIRKGNENSSRARDFHWLMVIAVFSNDATVGMITAGYSSLSLEVVIIGVNPFGFLGGGGAIDDLAAFAEDMDEEQKNTNAGKSFNSRPYGAFKALGQTVCVVLPLVKLYEMFTERLRALTITPRQLQRSHCSTRFAAVQQQCF